MAGLFVPRLVTCVGQRLTQMTRCAALQRPASSGLHRLFTTMASSITVQASRMVAPGVGVCAQIRAPLLGQCQQLACVQPAAGMKTKSALKKRCKDCFFVRRRGRLYVYCKSHPRHKQRQG